MKKVMPMALSVVLLVVFTSCKKHYTCECCASSGSFVHCTQSSDKMKKKEAKEWCEKTAYSGGVTTECKLK